MASLPYHVVNGKAYPRITSVLDHLRVPELEDWRADVGDVDAGKAGRQTARLGIKVDGLITDDLNGCKVRIPKTASTEVLSCWEAYQDWKSSRQPKVLSTQRRVWSDHYGLSGTLDFHDGTETGYITDWKCTRILTRKHVIQVNAYWPLLMERLKENDLFDNSYLTPPKIRLVRLDKHLGMFEEKVYDWSQDDWEIMLHLRDIHVSLFKEWYAQQPEELVHANYRYN